MQTLLSAIAGDEEIEALLSDEAQLVSVLAFESALAQATAEAGVISADAAAAVDAAIARFKPDWANLRAGMQRDGVVVPSLVAQLRAVLPEQHRAALHRGATSQDAVDTALSIQLRRILPILVARIAKLETSLAALLARYGAQPLMAHTRTQAALPITLGDKLESWARPLAAHRAALSGTVLKVQFGGPVGDRRDLDGQGGRIAAGLAARLHLADASAWHTAREPVAALGQRLALLTGSLGKIGADILLMAQTEVASIVLSGGGASSAMPHKSNPVNAEILLALAHHAASLSGTLAHAMIHEGERSGAAWTLEWLALPPLVVASGAALLRAQRLIEQVSFE